MHTIKFRRREKLKRGPAIVLTGFGTTRKGKSVYGILDARVRSEFKDYDVSWAYTSSIIREKTGKAGILQTLASLEENGFTRAVVQPLMIFPGMEYKLLAETCSSFPGLKVVIGESLLHRWHFVEEVLDIVSGDFIPSEQGINLLVAHGTPLSADSANIVYLGLDNILYKRYSNVFFCTVEGVPDSEGILKKIPENISTTNSGYLPLKARIIPFMYVSGLHVEEDLLGDQDSYKARLEEAGFTVECPTVPYQGEKFYKGLGFYEEIQEAFIERIRRSLELIRFYG